MSKPSIGVFVGRATTQNLLTTQMMGQLLGVTMGTLNPSPETSQKFFKAMRGYQVRFALLCYEIREDSELTRTIRKFNKLGAPVYIIGAEQKDIVKDYMEMRTTEVLHFTEVSYEAIGDGSLLPLLRSHLG